ncbi:MAG: enoyl-CoA hydratase/isomerase family protein [Deltaproteobacteria bacterium]|nr:enoyl-CoA hydratase/isomerase family protein [Deltaproteobacteria bacterium]
MPAELVFEIKDSTAFLALNRTAKKNALDGALLRMLLDRLDEIEKNTEIKVVVLKSASRDFFCAGADLSGMKNMEQAAADLKLFAAVLKRLYGLNKPSIAQVSGVCMGGGLGLALACSLTVASRDAVFSTPEIHLGLYPLMISPLIHAHCNSRKKADQFIMTGERFSAAQALGLGMLNDVVADIDLERRVDELIQALGKADPEVIDLGKKAVRDSEGRSFGEAVDGLCLRLQDLLALPGTQKRILAFLKPGIS